MYTGLFTALFRAVNLASAEAGTSAAYHSNRTTMSEMEA